MYSGNTIADNWWTDVFHDNSGAATLSGNTITGNGFKANASDKFYHGAVQITGPDVTVDNNTITGNHNAVVVIGYDLDSKGLTANNTTITNNTITSSGNTGIVTNGSSSVFTSSTIDYNDYLYADTGGRHWVWDAGGDMLWGTWNSEGNDTKGSLATP